MSTSLLIAALRRATHNAGDNKNEHRVIRLNRQVVVTRKTSLVINSKIGDRGKFIAKCNTWPTAHGLLRAFNEI